MNAGRGTEKDRHFPEGSGKGEPVVVLDAKYRIESEIDDAVQSIHVYRDALVRREADSHRRTVTAAFLVSPHSLASAEPADWRRDRPP